MCKNLVVRGDAAVIVTDNSAVSTLGWVHTGLAVFACCE